ncbi:integrase, catalytic region, zinc finger, CCHC-type containing protein [Tanacetum coccineum]
MTGDRSWLRNFVNKFIGTVRFGNDHFGFIMGYGDYVISDSVISRVYYVEGLGHNLFSVGQFCDSDLEVAFRKHSCYVRDTDGVELIKGSRGSNLYNISVEDMMKSSQICLLSKASKNKSWLWHRRLNYLNFGTINDLARKDLVRGLPRLKFEKDHLYKFRARTKSGSCSTFCKLEILFQPMFDEFLEPTRVERPVSPAPAVLVSVTSAGIPSSTTIDQDAPSPSHSMSSSAITISKAYIKAFAAEFISWKINLLLPVENDPFKNLIQKLRDDQKCMKKFEPSSRSKATEDIISIGSFVEVSVLNHFVLVRKILGKLSKLQDEDYQNKSNIQGPRKLWSTSS